MSVFEFDAETAHIDHARPEELVEKLCQLNEKVSGTLGNSHANDCFCKKGGFWDLYPGEPERAARHYRSTGRNVAFIIAATEFCLELYQEGHSVAQLQKLSDQELVSLIRKCLEGQCLKP